MTVIRKLSVFQYFKKNCFWTKKSAVNKKICTLAHFVNQSTIIKQTRTDFLFLDKKKTESTVALQMS